MRRGVYYSTGWFLVVWIGRALLWLFAPPVAWHRARKRRRERERAELIEALRQDREG
jgi:hypothetical protein